MKKDAYYFSHDSNSRNDVKCIKLRREMGMGGYGIFWAIIEMLRETPDYRLKLEDIEDIAFDLHAKSDEIKKVINHFGLFKIEDNYFFSDRLNKSMEDYNSLKDRLKEAGRKGGLSRAKGEVKQGLSKAQALNVNKIKQKKKVFSPDGFEEIERFLDTSHKPGMVY